MTAWRWAPRGGCRSAGRRFVERIIDFDPPRALAYTVEGLPRQVHRVTNRWTLRPTGGPSTVVELTTSVDMGPGPLRGLVERVIARAAAKQSDTMLAGIADRLETSRV